MIVNTKFEIGHTYWVPRSRKKLIEKKNIIDGEVWTCQMFEYEAFCKQKEVVAIKVHINPRNEVKVLYMVVDYGKYHQLSQCYSESDMGYSTEEEAMTIAKKWASEKQEYFGN
jgi:hypothetical protein